VPGENEEASASRDSSVDSRNTDQSVVTNVTQATTVGRTGLRPVIHQQPGGSATAQAARVANPAEPTPGYGRSYPVRARPHRPTPQSVGGLNPAGQPSTSQQPSGQPATSAQTPRGATAGGAQDQQDKNAKGKGPAGPK
jgi:hypothetical protein